MGFFLASWHNPAMSVTIALRLSCVVLVLSLLAAVFNIFAFLNNWPLPPGMATPLRLFGYLWPLAAYAVAVYRRKRETV